MLEKKLLVTSLKFLMAIQLSVTTDPSNDVTGLQYLHTYFSNSNAELNMADFESYHNITGAGANESTLFRLTNGKLTQKPGAETSPESPNDCQYLLDDCISCRISMIGWTVTYKGEIKHTELGNENFDLNIHITKWNLQQNPADLQILLKFTEKATDRFTSTTPYDFKLDAIASPAFKDLNMFRKKEALAENAWMKLTNEILRKVKRDVVDALISMYKVWVEGKIKY